MLAPVIFISLRLPSEPTPTLWWMQTKTSKRQESIFFPYIFIVEYFFQYAIAQPGQTRCIVSAGLQLRSPMIFLPPTL
ncbi:hypothetical protein M1D68_10725 [Pseudomonas sp. R4-84]